MQLCHIHVLLLVPVCGAGVSDAEGQDFFLCELGAIMPDLVSGIGESDGESSTQTNRKNKTV